MASAATRSIRLSPMRRSAVSLCVLSALGGIAAPAGALDFFWSTGNYSAAVGPNPIPANDTVFGIAGGNKDFNSINLVINGSLVWQTAERMGFVSSNVTVAGLVDLQADANLSYVGGGASNFFNTGTFRKSAGGGISTIGSNVNFSNSGVIEAISGTINFGGGAATFNAGTQFLGAGINLISSNASFNGSSTSSNLQLSSGNFTGSAAVLSGTTNWTGGGLVGGWQLAANQVINANSGGDKNFNSVNFTNQGTINWLTAERMGFVSSNVFNNALIDIQADANLSYVGGGASNFTNNGTLRKRNSGGTTTIGNNVNFTNNGVIDAQSGTIDFAGGAATFNAGTQFTGAGVVRIGNNATFDGSFTGSNLVFAAGNFTGGGIGGAVLNGTAGWSGGAFAGTWQLAAGQTLNASGAADKNFVSVNFTNDGTINWQTDARIGFVSSNFFNNGLLDIEADANLSYAGGGASNFTNNGTLRKRNSGGTTAIGNNVNFTNNGVIDAQSGTIDFAGGSATFNAGTQFSGGGIVRISNNATFNGTSTGANLVLAAGNFTGAAGAALNGAASWTGGQFAGTWELPSGHTITGSGLADKNFNIVNFTNSGVINWQTVARMGFVSSNLTNHGLIDLQADANLSYAGGGASNVTNSATGTLRKSGGTGSSMIGANIVFTNAGVIHAQSGTIDFAGGSATFDAGTQFTGAGVNQVSNNATFNGAFTSANLVLAGGNFAGGAAVLNGTAEITRGQFVGTWSVASGQTLNAKAGGDKNFNGTNFTNSGNIVWQTSERIGFVSSNVANNGLLDIQADANLSYAGGGASNFVNSGTLRKSAGAGATTIGANINFTNPGTIEALSGTIVLPNNFSNPGTIKGTATVQTNTLTNTGTIAPGASPGILTLSGSLVMGDTSVLDIELGGTGIGSYDQLMVTGTARLDGTLKVQKFGGFAPAVGNSFIVMSYASRVGQFEFDTVTPIGFGGGVLFSVAYNPTDVTLTVTAVPEPETYALMVAGLGMVVWAARRRRARSA